MDFYVLTTTEEKNGTFSLSADWVVDGNVTDLLVNEGAFQAVWDEEAKLWSRNEYTVQRLVDAHLRQTAIEFSAKTGTPVHPKFLRSSANKSWANFQKFIRDLPENRRDLDGKLIFANTEVKKSDYATKTLPYALEEGTIDAWDEIVGTLYSPEERAKIEWAIGAVVSGKSVDIQKFLVFYGKPGSGKSTILNIIGKLFEGYTTVFNARELTSTGNTFSLAPFAHNPLVAIQHDGDLSRIEDNTQLNMITAHEEIIVNAKYARPHTIRAKAFLFMGTNEPVKIKNAKAGIIRRLIDVTPSDNLIEVSRYHNLVHQTQFELGAIAYHCLQRFKKMGANYYIDYEPRKMKFETDAFYNFIEANHDIFKSQDGVSLKQAWEMYRVYCEDSGIRNLPRHSFRAELSNYFESFEDRKMVGGESHRSYFSGYKDIMKAKREVEETPAYQIELLPFDLIEPNPFHLACAEQPAQYAKPSGYPGAKWAIVKTVLKELDPTKLHYVQVPENHIVIDFDLTDEDGEKDRDRNLAEASLWPPTYTELSQGGAGVHLHYIYAGDVHELKNVYDVGIEVKTLLGDSALRRRLSQCNGLEIATISSGLPLKEKKMLDAKSVQSEANLRALIERNLRKEIHPGTKPSVDFIAKILEDSYEEGLSYDLRDLRPRILTFAAKSTNQSAACLKVVMGMKFVGKEEMPPADEKPDQPIVFYDVEVYPNLFVLCWNADGSDKVVRMINPEASDIEALLTQKLVGFNNRRYDNHIIYARYLGYNNEDLYRLSKKIIENDHSALFGEAYNLSYTDIYDFSSVKQSLKKFEVELGILHMELDLDWDKPVPEDRWDDVVEYCANDVVATKATFHARKADFMARQILARISGLTVNHTTQAHTAKIIFGDDKYPQSKFIYTDLSDMFPGYSFSGKESTYRGEVVGEGGYVYAEPGIYEDVALLDVASMHPASIEALRLFGPYTAQFSALKEARVAIKRKEYAKARSLLDGQLAEFLDGAEDDPSSSEALAYALKIVINIVYGLTSAKFPNAFLDNRNKDNIVAKRGALFMVNLKHEVQERGFTVAHIKTDSIKIPNATPEIIEFVTQYGAQYGYEFEHEKTFDKMVLVNDAVYVALADGHWTAVGAQFQHPYVYKTMFTHEGPTFADFCEVRSVAQGTMYLDTSGTGELDQMVHIGRTGAFVPVRQDGGTLWRVKDGQKYAVTRTKGYQWVTREVAEARNNTHDLFVDMDYFEKLRQDAVEAISQFGSVEEFTSI